MISINEVEEIDKKEYEISVLLKNEEDIKEMKDLMKKHGFEVTFESPFKRMSLSYEIKKEASAVFGWFYILSKTSAIKDFTKEIKVEPWCIRSLVITDPVKREFDKSDSHERQPRKEVVSKIKEVVEEEKITSDVVTNEDLEKKLEEILK